MTFANRSPPGAAKGSWRDAYPNVRARLNAKSEAEPGYTGYAALAKELLKLPELSNFDATPGSKDYKWLFQQVRNFFWGRRQTPEQLRIGNMKRKRARGRVQRAARLRIIYT